MAGELSERLVRRAARTAARETMLIRSINERFGVAAAAEARNREFERIARQYDMLPRNLNSDGWSPFVSSTSPIVNQIIQDLSGGGNNAS
tara:strand:- start:1561 stop:1830 length:270 start_codon:yes stop_codon:yes gene_type:complete